MEIRERLQNLLDTRQLSKDSEHELQLWVGDNVGDAMDLGLLKVDLSSSTLQRTTQHLMSAPRDKKFFKG